METKTCIVYYHGNDWDGVPARQRYLMNAMSAYLPVYYLDKGRDLPGRTSFRRASDRVTVVRGLARLAIGLDARRLGGLMRICSPWLLREIRRNYSNVILWTAENCLRVDRFVQHDLLVFDSIDPAFDRSPSALAEFERRESDVLRAADIVFASAEALQERCRKDNANVTLLNNACEPSEYTDVLVKNANRPEWWPKTEKPIAAFLGSLDWRLDVEALEQACELNPDVQFVLAGHIYGESVPGLDRLIERSNVTVPGQVSVSDGRYLLAHCAIGLIPYLPGEMNDAINPVKLYTYALLGKPILGTAIRELLNRPEIPDVARTPETFGRMIRSTVAKGRDPQHGARLKAYALENTWAHRADTAFRALQPYLGASRTSEPIHSGGAGAEPAVPAQSLVEI